SLTNIAAVGASPKTPLTTPANEVTVSVNIPSTPAANFAGTAGGDGFNVVHANGRVYNVFHHQASVVVNCHDELTSEDCTYGGLTWPIEVSASVGTGMYSNAFTNKNETKLFVWAVVRGQSAGIQCMKLEDGSDCGYQVLSVIDVAGNETTIDIGSAEFVDWGSPARVGNKIYTPFAEPTGQTWLACFNLATESPCAQSAYKQSMLEPGVESFEFSIFNGPHAIAYGKYVYSNFFEVNTFNTYVDCWDTEENSSCEGVWPRANQSPSSWMPVLNQNQEITLICSLEESVSCLDAETGEDATTPDHLAELYGMDELPAFIGTSLIFGKKVVSLLSGMGGSPLGTAICFDYSTATPTNCGTIELPDTSFVYSLDRDPNRPTCVWVNADNGLAQITNFDVLTMEQGCSGSLRTSLIQISTKGAACDVTEWDSLKITSPSQWTSATVTVRDENGDVLPGGNEISISQANVKTSLANVDFGTLETPYFDFDIQGADLSNGLNAQFTWTTSTPKICKGLKETSKTSYTGTTGSLNIGKNLKVAGKVTPKVCGNDLIFTLNRNPFTGVLGDYVIDGGNYSTENWKAGSYAVTVTQPANDYCKASNANKSFNLTVDVTPDLTLKAKGWYLHEEVRSDFSFNIKTDTTSQGSTTINKYQGSVSIAVDEEWKFSTSLNSATKIVNGVVKSGKLTFTEISCPDSPAIGNAKSDPKCYLVVVKGKVSSWDAGSSSWVNPQDASFAIKLFNGGTYKKKIKGVMKDVVLPDFVSFNLITEIEGLQVPETLVPVKLKGTSAFGYVK
ncbi:MAG: hypothetical protein RLZZ330_596, partial [Actinomycetota bacterium]